MADTKISALTVATTPLAGTEVLPIVQSGVTKQVSVADLTAGRAVSALSLSLTNALTATNGGTGQSSYAVGDLLYASTTTALSKLADVATGNALISGGVGAAPSWGKIGLTTHVSGTLPTANGGTNLTSFTSGGIVYASSTSVLATGSALTYDGTTFNAPKSIATSTSAGALVDIFTLVNASNTAGTEAGIFFSPTTASGNIRGARISAYQVTGNNDIGLKFYTGNGATIAVAQTISPTSDITFNLGNLVQGTAAKGINFTANSAAAGKTSQLLNWYEEGTWTPNQGAGLTVVGAFSSSGTYTRVGRQITVRGQVTGATSVAVTAAGVISNNLPYAASVTHAGSMFNDAVNVSGSVQITSSSVVAASVVSATPSITFTATYTV